MLHVCGNEHETWVVLDQLAQSTGEEILEAGEDDGDGSLWRHDGLGVSTERVGSLGEASERGLVAEG